MNIGKREVPKMRHASDGSVEWRCSKCFLFKPIATFSKVDERRGYVCGACDSLENAGHRNTEAFILDPLLCTPCKPLVIRSWERAVWKHIRKRLLPGTARVQRVILGQIKAGRYKNHREGLLELLATTDIARPDEYFWFVFRQGLLGNQILRLYAVGVAKYAAKLSCLYEQDRRVEDVLFEVRHVAIAQDSNLFAVRQVAYDILEKLQQTYNPVSQVKAAMALTATCFPEAYEAALAATGWTAEMWLAVKGMLVQTEANKVDRSKALLHILGDMRQLVMGLVADWVENHKQEEKRNLMKFKVGAVDYDALDD